MHKVVLYHTQGCHLCEQAYELLLHFFSPAEVNCIDIVDDEAMMNLYQCDIPVAQNCLTQALLKWPFNAQQIQEVLK
ncbi:glutaredoxin family protein [Pseudoalteromonas tunicata]|uniref:glutaredoxin family protein n=1 Tax=Pseudoalteromonas tunicata TaxID=314281 RepID=UPI00273DC767|nr:glutaredoxin family protein [Pseudoalteromonas tunicata]MDP4985465.1 glutaredoxin family protein [Pseudoalteromonas tunicata]MDP5212169.1 glutaredoxin family protein [Pseudoalteromonas tunicata]